MTDIERFEDLGKKIVVIEKAVDRREMERQAIEKQIDELRTGIKGKYNLTDEQIEEYLNRSDENLKAIEDKINEMYLKVK